MAFFQVAFDGSGAFNTKDRAIAYAGAVATGRQWAAFTDSWNSVLTREGLAYFKMAEAMTWFGEFAGRWSKWGDARDEKRTSLLNELADLAVRYDFRATGMWSDANVLTAHQTVTDKKVELFKAGMLVLLQAVPDGNHVSLLMDEELDIEPSVRKWVREMRQRRGKNIAPITAVCHVDDRAFPAVQFADMVAWLYREYGDQVIATDGGNAMLSPLLAKVMHSTQFTIHKTEPGTLLNGLRQFEDGPDGTES